MTSNGQGEEDTELAAAVAEVEKTPDLHEPVLRGWGPDSAECAVPVTLTDKDWDTARAAWGDGPLCGKEAPAEKQYREFPLYYGKGYRTSEQRTRRYAQIASASAAVERSHKLVLMTADYRVYRARGIWHLLWIYLRTMFFGIRDVRYKAPVPSSNPPLPKYVHE